MPDVVLIGDSIRMGYEAGVRKLFPERDIWSPEENGGDCQRIRQNLDAWATSRSPSVIHINCGLHDLKKDFETGTAAVPLEDYEENVLQILSRLKRETESVIIWALTTPVNEAWHHARKGFDRLEVDVLSYNATARKICEDLQIPVNDLYSIINQGGRDALLKPDGVHFEEPGCELLARAVADVLQKHLPHTQHAQ